MSNYVNPKQRRKQAAWNASRREQEERIAAGIRLATMQPILCECRNHLGNRKTPHETRAEARTAADELRKLHGNEYRVFKCPKSDKYHVATKREASK